MWFWKCFLLILLNVFDYEYSYYAAERGEDLTTIELVDDMINIIGTLDKNGDMFRYPTDLKLRYYLNEKTFDLKNIYKFQGALINCIDSFYSFFDEIENYQNDMRAEYASEMSSYMLWTIYNHTTGLYTRFCVNKI